MQRMNKIDDCLNLSPIIKDYIEYQLLERDEEKGKYNIKSGMNFITWLWGSGKTFFIEETLKHLKEPKDYLEEPKDYLWKRKFIRIDFSPRNLETTGSIYSHFLDTFILGLLSEKYDPNLKGYKSNLLKILGAWTGNNYLDMFFKLFNLPSENVQDILKSINDSLQTTYKDYFIVVIIDDIDRVEKKDLLNIGKILNLLKNLTSMQKEEKADSNLICFYSADSNYLNNFYLWDHQEEKGINFYQYFNKFRDSQIDVYDATYQSLITFLRDSILEIDNKVGIFIIRECEWLFASLKEKDIAVTIRDLLFLKKEILEKFQQNIDKAQIELVEYSDIIAHEEVSSYFYFWDSRVTIFLLYLYTKSMYEKDSNILLGLDKAIEKQPRSNDEDEIIIKIKNENHFFFRNIDIWGDSNSNYYLIKQLITNGNNAKSFKDHILNRWIESIVEEIKKPDFKNIEKFHQIVKRLFRSSRDKRTIYIMDKICQNILNNIDKNSWKMLNIFLENYIQIITEYLKNISKYQWDDLIDEREWHLNKICQILSEFTSKEWSLLKKIYDESSDFPKQWLDTIENFFKEIQSNNNIEYQFIFLYFILHLNIFSKETNPIAERFTVDRIIKDKPAFIWNLTRNFLNRLPRSSNNEKDKQTELIITWRTILYGLLRYPQWKELPLLKLFGKEASLLILIYSITNIIKDWRIAFEANQDVKENEYYKKIYQELLEYQMGDIKPLIKKYKDNILIRYKETQTYWEKTNIDFLSNLEWKISIETISDSLNSFYWTDSN